MLLAAIFVIACFNTCVGLISSVGQYFHELMHLPYPAVAAFFAVTSMLISNLGLAGIIRLSTPVLNAVYPIAIVLIALSFVDSAQLRHIRDVSTIDDPQALETIYERESGSTLSALANALPFSSLGFGWLLPAAAGLLLGLVLPQAEKA